MDLALLKTFVATAEVGSITRAALRLHLSQPAVSGQLKRLEELLEVPLFRRNARGMTLTPAGDHLLPLARELLTRSDAFVSVAARLAGRTAGILRVGMIDCGYELYLPRIVASLTRQHPELQVEIRTATSGMNLRALRAHELDAVFVEGPCDTPDLRRIALGTSRVGIVVPKAWRDRADGASFADLARLPWVGRAAGCSYTRLLDALCEEAGTSVVPHHVAATSEHTCAMVAAGMGVAFADLDDAASRDDELWVWPGYAYPMPVWCVTLEARRHEPLLESWDEVVRRQHTGRLHHAG